MSFSQSMMGLLMSQVSQDAGSLYKIDGGTFTLAEDFTSGTYTINHNLGVVPDVVAVFTFAIPLENGVDLTSPMQMVWCFHTKNDVQATLKTVAVRVRTNNPPASLAADNSAAVTTNNTNAQSFGIQCQSTGGAAATLKGGIPYYWVALKVL